MAVVRLISKAPALLWYTAQRFLGELECWVFLISRISPNNIVFVPLFSMFCAHVVTRLGSVPARAPDHDWWVHADVHRRPAGPRLCRLSRLFGIFVVLSLLKKV